MKKNFKMCFHYPATTKREQRVTNSTITWWQLQVARIHISLLNDMNGYLTTLQSGHATTKKITKKTTMLEEQRRKKNSQTKDRELTATALGNKS